MVTEAHLVLLVFPGLEQGNLNSQDVTLSYNMRSCPHVKEVCPHSVAMVSLVKDEVIMDWSCFIDGIIQGSRTGAVGIVRVTVGGHPWNQPVLEGLVI